LYTHILFSPEEKVPEVHMIENFQSFLKLRARSNWEACDSGILIWRNSIAYILLFLAIPFLLCVILLSALSSLLTFFAPLILWWLKPFFDRFILQVISVRFFQSDAKYKTIRKNLLRNIFTGLIGDITWRRFSLYRAARIPVRILEGNKGKMIKRRIKNLKNGGLDFCALLTSLCMILEIALIIIFSIFLYGFFSEYAGFTFDLLLDYSPQVSLVLLFIISISLLIAEPLYMCMGFGIYINSRSTVEGWDIEWKLNSFTKENKNESANMKIQNAAKIIFIILFFSFFLINFPLPLQAEEWYQSNSEEVPVEVLDEVLSSEDFGSTHTKKWIRFKDFSDDERSSGLQFDESNIKNIVGIILRALLVIIIIGGLIFAAYRVYKLRKKLSPRTIVPWRKNSIPGFAEKEHAEILIDNAKKYFAVGQIRKAWAACLSAALTLYAEQGNILFAMNDTELDCLVRINQSTLEGKEESSQLILHWIKLAYAGIEPEQKHFHNAILFCENLKTKYLVTGDAHE
jgi:uncharacterized membrane protein